MKIKKMLSFLTALTMCSLSAAAVYADESDTADMGMTIYAPSEDISGETPDDISEDTPDDTVEDTDNVIEIEDDIYVPEESTDTHAEDTVTYSAYTELTADEEVFLLPAWVQSWDKTNGVLTLQGQLPNTYYDREENIMYDLATLTDIDRSAVKKIVITSGVKAGSSAGYMFWYMNNLTQIQGLSNLDTSKVTDMCSMFRGCSSLTSLDLSKFDTSKVTNMNSMFSDCYALTSLDLSKFDTSKVEYMSYMFYDCSSLTSLDLSKFNTSKVTDMSGMFSKCSSLTSLDLSKFDTSNVTDMFRMFYDCSSLTSLDLSKFDTSKVTNMRHMFAGCTKLTTIKVSDKWTTSAVTESDDMFYNCTNLMGGAATFYNSSKVDQTYARIDKGTSEPGYLTAAEPSVRYDASSQTLILKAGSVLRDDVWACRDNNNVKHIVAEQGAELPADSSQLFTDLSSVTDIDLSKADTSAVTDMSAMFIHCKAVTKIDLTGFNTSKVTNMEYMFSDCQALTSLDISMFDTSEVTTMKRMFYRLNNIKNIDLSNFDTSGVENMEGMFASCTALASVDLSKLHTSKVTKMGGVFSGCSALTSLDLTSFDTSNVTDMKYMFNGCTKLTTIKVSSKWTTSAVTDSQDMFTDSTKLRGGAGTVYNSSKTDKTYAHIDGGTSDPGYLTAASTAPDKPTVVIKTAFGGKTVQFNCTDPQAEIYYQTGSSNITASSKHVKAGTMVFFNTPMTGKDAAIYFKAYKNGKWSVVGKWGLLNVKIDKPIITPSGKASENNFKVYTQTKNSYIIYTLDGSVPSINEGTQKLTVKNGKIVWGTSAVINIPKGKTIKAIAIRNGLVTSDVVTYTNK